MNQITPRYCVVLLLALLWLSPGAGRAQESQDDTGAREPGVSLRVYDVGKPMVALPKLVEGQTPNVNRRIETIDLEDDGFDLEYDFYAEVTGTLTIDEPGVYRFGLTSDDGSVLLIDGKAIINHDGLHGAETKFGQVELESGEHELQIRHFQARGDARLALRWAEPGTDTFEPIPTDALSTPDQVRVTSPGEKQVVLADAARGQAGRAGDRQPLNGVHPAYDLVTIHPDDFNPRVGGLDFLSDGRLVLCTWDRVGGVYILDNVQGERVDPAEISIKRIAAGLAEPLGLTVIQDPQTGEDRIFVLQKQELTELIDHDGDEVIDEYRVVSDDWAVSDNFHEFAFGLLHRDGKFYGSLAVAIDPGGATTKDQQPGRGTVRAIDMKSGEAKVMATGLRTPNGLGWGPEGHVVVMDNQGAWRPASTLHVVEAGAFLGHHMPDPAQDPPNADGPVTPPAVWLPQGEIGNSPSQPVLIPDGPYAGQMLHGEVTHGGIKRDYLEKIDGVWQGAVFRFSQGFEAGVNRIALTDDGQIYAGCIGTQGNWSHRGNRTGLQKLVPNGQTAFEMLAVRAMNNGFQIEFTQPLAEGAGWNPADYHVQQWRYEPTPSYGGPKKDQAGLVVRSASVSPDRTRVFLEIPGLKPEHVVYFRLDDGLRSEDDERVWSTEAWYTLNRIPEDRRGEVRAVPASAEAASADDGPVNELTDAEAEAGWELLFDGESLDGWRGFRKEEAGEGWRVEDGAIHRAGPAGDLITGEQFDNFELKMQWKISEGGNSGIFIRVAERVEGEPMNAVWHTGPEMQVLDNAKHPDGRSPKTSAGANYALHPAPREVTRPVGEWNDVHIIADGNKITYKLNGQVTASFEIGSDDWQKRVAESKFRHMPHFAQMERGHIAIQDHGNPVWYRNITIRPIERDEDDAR